MWEKIRKSVLAISFVSALVSELILIETGKFESPIGLFLVLINLAYVFLFTAANIRY